MLAVFWILGAANPIRFQVPDYCVYIQLVRGYSREAWGKGEPAQPSRAASEYPVLCTWLFRLVLPLQDTC